MSTDLHIAAGDDDLEEVKRLIKEGADINKVSIAGITPLHVAAGEVSFTNVSLIKWEYPMHREARSLTINEQGAETVVEFLCKTGADVNAGTAFGNETAIHKAALDGHHNCISHLMAASANIDAVSSDGFSALHEACREGNTETVRFLLEKGLNLIRDRLCLDKISNR